MRLKKGELTAEAYKVLMHDLESLDLSADPHNQYHYTLLKANLRDLFGRNKHA